MKKKIFITFLCSFVLLFSKEIDGQIYENEYGQYYIPENHEHRDAVKKTINGQVYEKETLEYISSIYPEGTSIVHAGTFFGDMLPFFSKLVGSNNVWAFEPVSLNYEYAIQNIALNNLENVNLFNYALSDSTCSLLMLTSIKGKQCGGGSRIVANSKKINCEYEYVEGICLDDLLKNNSESISMIHLDVEGHEIQALKGAKKIIEKHKPILILELNNEEKLNEYLYKMGYEKIDRKNGNGIYIPFNKN